MLFTIAMILVILWVIGFITNNTFGGFIHIIITLAIMLLIFQLLKYGLNF